jgi:hypothetical protein
VYGTFNRVTFPAFVLVPLVQLAMQRYAYVGGTPSRIRSNHLQTQRDPALGCVLCHYSYDCNHC